MLEYLFDVALTFRTYVFIALGLAFVVYIIGHAKNVYPKGNDPASEELVAMADSINRFLKFVIGLVLVFGVFQSFTSGVNTPKNVVFDNTQKNRQITQQIIEAPKGEIVDRTRQPKFTDEERKARFDEMVKY